MHNRSHENEFNLHVSEIVFCYERKGTKTRFEKEAKGNSVSHIRTGRIEII